MAAEITWPAEAVEYLRSRSRRYESALDIEPSWTLEVLADPDLVAFEPDPNPGSVHRGSLANRPQQASCSL